LTGEDSSSRIPVAPFVDTHGSERTIIRDNSEPSSLPQVLDRVELLARVDGDRTLLAELVRLFIEERPALVSAMENSLRDGDARELARAAHKAKGAFGNLSAPAAMQGSAELELLARHGELALATDVFLQLRGQIERLEAELVALTQDDRAA
jgi:HPt (histidine-containing phosphotransfer) domain-containing protein